MPTVQNIRPEDLRPGDRLAQDVFVGTQVLLRSGTLLQIGQIERLRRLPLQSVAAVREQIGVESAASQYTPDTTQYRLPPIGGPDISDLSKPGDEAWLSNEYFHHPVEVPEDIGPSEKMFAMHKDRLRSEAGLEPAVPAHKQEMISKELHASLISGAIKKLADLEQLSNLADSLSEAAVSQPEGYLRFGDIGQYGQYLAAKAVSAALVFSRVCPEDSKDQLKELTRSLFALTALFAVLPGAREPEAGMSPDKREQLGEAMLRYFEWANSAQIASEEVLQTVLLQFERADGTGVPYGLNGQMIPQASASLGLSSVYAGKTLSQPRQARVSPRQAADQLISQSGTAFSGPSVNKFLKSMGYYPVGSLVELSDGRSALVVGQNVRALLKPVVKVVSEEGKMEETLDLLNESKVFIRRQLLEY